MRITAQLIRVQDQTHLWAENYDRQLPGILDIHGEIGAAIADQVKLELIAEERRQLTGTPLGMRKRTICICEGVITTRDSTSSMRKKP